MNKESEKNSRIDHTEAEEKTAALCSLPGLSRYVRLPRYRQALGLPEEVEETYELLAQGEYNRNYVFTHPLTGKRLLLRINFGSQMHLDDQIGYEYRALKLLENSGRTPRAFFADGSKTELDEGLMVMEHLPGHALRYETELFRAAPILADIHSQRLPEAHGLLIPKDPLRAILEECEEMFGVYTAYAHADAAKIRKIRSLLDLGWREAEKGSCAAPPYRCAVNTELNAANFLIGAPSAGEAMEHENAAGCSKAASCGRDHGGQAGQAEPKKREAHTGFKRDFLIDWEKPVFSDPAQDLGHFLAPTTTFWKTDVILTDAQIDAFLAAYIEAVGGRYDTEGLLLRTAVYLPVTCLRGITWCAMAWVQYQEPGRELCNESTRKKLDAYLDERFLAWIEAFMRERLECQERCFS